MNARTTLLFLASVGFSMCFGLTNDAEACGNSIEEHFEPEVNYLRDAESELARGRLAVAANLAVRAYPGLREMKYVRGLRPLRAARVMALSIVRSGGAWLEGGKLVLGDEKKRADNLDWAVRQLRLRAEAAPKTASYKVDLGEALASVARHHKEASALLEALHRAQLIQSPHAYSALSRLRAEAGNQEGASEATLACQRRARDKTICEASPKEAGKARSGGKNKA